MFLAFVWPPEEVIPGGGVGKDYVYIFGEEVALGDKGVGGGADARKVVITVLVALGD